ncbi:MAG TPA: GNAT family N-acetyltransferase [Candidatus Agrococcus pullicola]|uniref:GNAT family N-acetyltransferase n=1 Tax=Candidatus Agrococcus pullicola TaxID=2838429 RepID=A0A9D2CAB7_9MICO|nr:GNAT family N-acetyltransferase [Candidatus Agrococcus pullicola]
MIRTRAPEVDELEHVGRSLAQWLSDDGPVQLHPGDLGWYSLRGAAATADAVRVWSEGERILAVSLLDGPGLLRFAVHPEHRDDSDLAQRITADVAHADAGVLATGAAVIEVRGVPALDECLAANGWSSDEPWTPLRRNLRLPVEAPGIRVENVKSDDTEAWWRVHWSAFRGTPVPEARLRSLIDGWRLAADGPFFSSARILAGFNDSGEAVAVSAVWSAGEGRPGLLEPMGVHREQRGHGYGKAITLAAAAALRALGASSALVATESSNFGGVATYAAAGFEALTPVRDWARKG